MKERRNHESSLGMKREGAYLQTTVEKLKNLIYERIEMAGQNGCKESQLKSMLSTYDPEKIVEALNLLVEGKEIRMTDPKRYIRKKRIDRYYFIE